MNRICLLKDVYKELSIFEYKFREKYNMSVNEAMIVCIIASTPLSAGDIASNIGLLPSHTSKLIKLLEDKGIIQREMGKEDKRQMIFSLTSLGNDVLEKMNNDPIALPKFISINNSGT